MRLPSRRQGAGAAPESNPFARQHHRTTRLFPAVSFEVAEPADGGSQSGRLLLL